MEPSNYTLIGDMVESRNSDDRTRLQSQLRSVLHLLNEDRTSGLRIEQRLEPTVGDEFQGVFGDLFSAVSASLLIRLELLKAAETDCRCGLGFGAIDTFDESSSPLLQDGPGWWSARLAIEEAHELAEKSRSAFLRTRFRSDPSTDAIGRGEVSAVNAFLIMRDSAVGEMKPVTRRILLGYLKGKSQETIAKEEDMTQSNVSQTLSRSGAHSIRLAQEQLERTAE